MNRPLANLGSAGLAADQQGETAHRYLLALYRLQQRLTDTFPQLLLENCCSGGGRFDPGMLFYSPQIWCSDDTDAVERLKIQEGTALLYPLSAIGAHVSACPNHILGRVTPFATRAAVAMAGSFGYELDLNALAPEEAAAIPRQIALYKELQPLIQTGSYYRLASLRDGGQLDVMMAVSRQKDEAAVFLARVLASPNPARQRLRLKGLTPSALYEDAETGQRWPGDVLCQLGLPAELPEGDFTARVIRLRRV